MTDNNRMLEALIDIKDLQGNIPDNVINNFEGFFAILTEAEDINPPELDCGISASALLATMIKILINATKLQQEDDGLREQFSNDIIVMLDWFRKQLDLIARRDAEAPSVTDHTCQ